MVPALLLFLRRGVVVVLLRFDAVVRLVVLHFVTVGVVPVARSAWRKRMISAVKRI